MDSINSWINEDEVRKLAEDLTSSPEVEKGEGEDFEGFAMPEKQGESSRNASDTKADELAENDLDEETATELPQEVKESKSSSLAGASAMAATAGLLGLGKKKSEPKVVETVAVEAVDEVKEVEPEIEPEIEPVKDPVVNVWENIEETNADSLPPLCDHCLNEIPGNVDENVKVSLPKVNPDKELGTFEQIDQQLSKTVRANGICVIDRDGDVLYSSLKNQSLVAFTIEAMMGTKLMRTQDGEFGNIRIKVAAGEYLEFVSVKSTRGVLILAASMNHALGATNAQYIAGDILKIANLV